MVDSNTRLNSEKEEPATGVTENKKADILQAMFQHYADVGLDHQRQSATTSNILLVIAGAILTLVGRDKNMDSVWDAMGAAAVAVIGGFGMMWSWKQHQTYKFWTTIAGTYQKDLCELMPGLQQVGNLYRNADCETAKEYGAFTVRKLRIRYLWVGLHGVVMLLGITLAVAILLLIEEYIVALAIGFLLSAFMIWILIRVINIRVFQKKTGGQNQRQ
jgi:hypothetical protein